MEVVLADYPDSPVVLAVAVGELPPDDARREGPLLG